MVSPRVAFIVVPLQVTMKRSFSIFIQGSRNGFDRKNTTVPFSENGVGKPIPSLGTGKVTVDVDDDFKCVIGE